MSYITVAKALEPRRGAAVLLEVLQSEGVQYIFGNPGTTELAMIDALTGWPEIEYIWGLQEATVVAMADGYAQTSGRPGFINLHTAAGLGNGMGALLNAQVSKTPLVVTAGQQDMRHTLTDPLLSGDLVRIAGPAVKWAHEVTHPDQLPVVVRRAFNDCAAAPTGSVFLSLPMNVMEAMTTVDIGERSTIDRTAVAGSLERLSDMLAELTPGKSPSSPATRYPLPTRARRPYSLPKPWGHRCSARLGHCTFHFRLRTHFGRGTCRSKRVRFEPNSSRSMPCWRSADSLSSRTSTRKDQPCRLAAN